jgi:ribosomal protein L22
MDLIILWLLLACFVLGGFIGLFKVIVDALKFNGVKGAENNKALTEQSHVLVTRIAGVSHQNETGPSRQVCIESLKPYEELWLSADPENRFDRNAIKVLSEIGQLGFLPRETAVGLSGADLGAIGIELKSKGLAENGLWGCTIELKLPKTAPGVPEPPSKNREHGFRKNSAVKAAKAGLLGRNQLLAVIDQATHLGLNKEDLAVFEIALHRAPVSKTKRPLSRLSNSGSSRDYDDPIDPTDIDYDNGFDGVGEYWQDYHKHD